MQEAEDTYSGFPDLQSDKVEKNEFSAYPTNLTVEDIYHKYYRIKVNDHERTPGSKVHRKGTTLEQVIKKMLRTIYR
jgi:hypothetical protein